MPSAPVVGGRVEALSGSTMGTTWTVRAVVDDDRRLAELQRLIEATLGEQIAVFSHWEPTSELSRFNGAQAGRIPVSAALWHVVETALDLAAQTDGAVDPTLGALVDLWGFGPPGPRDASQPLPQSQELERAMALCGWTHLQPDAATRTLVQPGGLRLDLSGIAKGHAVDQVSECLSAMGVDHHLVEIGGEMRGRGLKPDGMPWWAEIEASSGGSPRTLVALQDLALATSGDAERGFNVGQTRFSHTLDGRTGRPIDNGVTAVSVLADTALEADALATAISVLGARDGLEFADAGGIAALITTEITGRTVEHISAAAQAMLEGGA